MLLLPPPTLPLRKSWAPLLGAISTHLCMHVNTRSHARIVIIIIDTTVWPADQEYLENIIDKSSDLAHGSGNTLVLSLAPQLHAKVTA